MSQQSADGLKPFAITFNDGYYAVWQCWSYDHAEERIRRAYPPIPATGKSLRHSVSIQQLD